MKNTFIFLSALFFFAAPLHAQRPGSGNVDTNNFISLSVPGPVFAPATASVPAARKPGLTGAAALSACFSVSFVKQGATGSGSTWADASGDIQAMIDAAADCGGGEVWVAAGTYIPVRRANATGTVTPNDRDNAFVLRNNVRVFGGFAGTETALNERVLNPASPSLLSGDFNGNDQVSGSGSTLTFEHNSENAYHVVISAGNNSTAVIDGFTVSGGFADGSSGILVNGSSIFRLRGGGMYNQSSSPVIRNCIFSKNSTHTVVEFAGGGMYNSSSSPSISNSTFSLNLSYLGGGMINFISSFPTISHCNFSGNLVVSDGSGMNNQNNAAPTVSDCMFTDNVTLTGSGGGMLNLNNASNAVIENCTFTGNISGNVGGGMVNATASPVITNSVFANNTAVSGGGMYNAANTAPSIDRSRFTGNIASGRRGGGMMNVGSSPSVSNSLFAGNTAPYTGGGMVNVGGSNPRIINSTFAANTAGFAGGGIRNNESAPVITNVIVFSNSSGVEDSLSTPAVTFSLVQGGDPGQGNSNADPLFVNAAAGDYHLQGCSPAINSGSNTAAFHFGMDLDGEARIQQGNVDMGAFEDDGLLPVKLSINFASPPATCEGTDGMIMFNTNLPDGEHTLSFRSGTKDTTASVMVTTGFIFLNGLGRGNFSGFSITHGCTGSADTTINFSDGPAMLLFLLSTDPSACGLNNGSMMFLTDQPDGIYELSFEKDGKDTVASVSVSAAIIFMDGLGAGTYTNFSLMTTGFCEGTFAGPVTLDGPPAPGITVDETAGVSACGSTDGSITFITGLPDGSYTLAFKKGGKDTTANVTVSSNAFSLTGLGEGSYSAFSITHNNCTSADGSVQTISAPAAAALSVIAVIQPLTCAGVGSLIFFTGLPDATYTLQYKKDGADLSASVIVAGGAFLLSDLPVGSYSDFSITDQNCVIMANETKILADPVTPVLTAGALTHPATCGGTGSIAFTTTNLPDGIYTLSYNKGLTPLIADIFVLSGEFTLSNLTAGAYTDFSITISGCTATVSGPVTLLNPLAPASIITPDGPTELCEDDVVTLTAAEGASYLWNNGKTTRSITVSEGGTYSVTVTSAQGCQSPADITVTKKICNLPPVAVCKPLVVLVAGPDCYAQLNTRDIDGGSYDPNNDWTRHTLLNTDGLLRTGQHTVTYEVMDPKGAFSTCQSQVRVVDHSPPVALARSLTLELGADGQAFITVADVDAGSYDNCGPVSLSLNRSNFDCTDLGHLQVRLTVTDASGNVSEGLAGITIVDHTPPVIRATDLTLALDENGRAVINTQSMIIGISDNCAIGNVNISPSEFTCAHIGKNEVTITVEDVQGNRSTATVTVTVEDSTPPVVKAKDMTLYLDKNGKATPTTAMIDESSSDNCGITRLSLDREAFDCKDLGEQVLTLTATDGAGNSSEATFTVTVRDTLAPTVLAGDITLYLDAAGKASLSAADIDKGSSDNCGIAERKLQYTAFDCSDVRTQPVEYTVTDGSGNRTSVTLQVTVRDTITPEAIAQNVVLELNADGKATLTADEADGGSTDNCGIAEMSLSQTEFSCTDLGRRLLTFTVRDVNGNQGTDRAIVEVKDPNGVCPCSYGVLAFEGITMKHNEVSAGGVGVISKGRKVRLRNTVIHEQGTFVKAPQSRFDRESEASTYIRGEAPRPEGFRSNANKDKKREKVGRGESLTLTAGRYGRIKAGKEATLTFSGGEVYIRSLKVKKGASLVFSDNTTLLVRDGVKLGRGTAINTAGEQIRIYAGNSIKVGNASEVRGYLHTQGRLKVGGGSETTSLEGLFVADRIRGGRNTHWAGGGVLCTGNNEPEAATLAGARKAFEHAAEAMATDSTGLRVNLWPNPVVTDVLKVSVESDTPDGELLLVDLQGNILAKKAYKGYQDNHEFDLSRATPGIYVLRVSSGGKVKTLRVVKENR